MKTSLSLLGLIALSGSAFVACGPVMNPVPIGSGGAGSGGVGPIGSGGVGPIGSGGVGPIGSGGDGPVGTGGDTGSGGAATSNVLFDGTSTWVNGEMNTIGIQGAFFILEDSVKDDAPVDDGFPHTDLTADSGGIEDMPVGVSKFGPDTVKPCVSGTVAQVLDEAMMTGCDDTAAETEPGACQWTKQWGGGIGLNLSETGGDDSVKSVWNALTANAGAPVLGFKFMASGTGGGATLRVKAKNPGDDTDYCKEFTIVPGVEVDVKIAEFKPECWGSTSSKPPLQLDNIESLQWQVVSSKAMSYTVANLCIDSISWY